MTLDIDRGSGAPLHFQISEALRKAVTNGQLQGGARLPSTRSLASDWQVSRNTVLQVFETLISEGFLEARVGDGTYVKRHASTGIEVAAKDEHTPEAKGTPYPFRGLSQRGKALIEHRLGGLTERPTLFMPDVPDLQAFPIRSWLRLMNEVSGRLKGDILVNVSNAGYEPLREAIAHHLRAARGMIVDSRQVIITTGSQQSLDLLARLLVDRGDPVWMEEPGYVGARAALTANGCSVLPIPTDEAGMNVELGRARYPTPRMILVSPSRHYPLGATLSAERRQQLLDFSRATGAWILEDDYDCEFRYRGPSPASLQSADRDGRVVSIGTFSKTLLPSFRLGFVVVPTDLADDFAKARAVIDRHAPIMEQMVLAEFMHRGLYSAHIRRMRSLYLERQEAMLTMLADWLSYAPPDFERVSGMHFVLPFREGVDDTAVARQLWEHRIVSRPLSMYYGGRNTRPGLLLGFAAFRPEDILAAGKYLEGMCDLVRHG
ncbi:MAG: PLP-dependent aminotransferase family protein [Rhodopseudomonas palustris]|uniref:PLP-dependent aminotransferase family protein n=1 Tax=Rhodopseudomonas palustris TaxID=1076 RepID=A0A933S3W7_RHOPL|nr:PLP-dependent aminotransferase family protein [Rhodopseudomonas palustris]